MEIVKPTFADLFAGIGGFRLGLERAGFEYGWGCEIDDFCRKVYAKNFGAEPEYKDIRDIKEAPYVDLIAGGFPCQDVSYAGYGAGITGERSGLWWEMVRTVRLVRPQYIIVENVAALLYRGMGEVLGEMAEIGDNAEWDCLPAGAFGARHFRDRIFIIETTNKIHNPGILTPRSLPGYPCQLKRWMQKHRIGYCDAWEPWADKSELAITAYGIPRSMDAKVALGNAVVPQVVEWIRKRIMEVINSHADSEEIQT